MPGVRDHEPIIIEDFNGLWKRGDAESAPLDHFTQADNIQYFNSGFETRDPLDIYETLVPLRNIIRMYNYVMQTGPSLLVLVQGGQIYHIIGPTLRYGPILTIPAMEDFGFVAIAGRAYITPFKTYTVPVGQVGNPATMSFELGLQNEFVYVYKGDGTPARKAGGFPPVNSGKLPFLVYNSLADGGTTLVGAELFGPVTQGIHVVAVVANNGILGPEVYPVFIAPGDKQMHFANIPLFPGGPGAVPHRTLVMTKAIPPSAYVPGQVVIAGYPFYRLYDIQDNISTSLTFEVTDEQLGRGSIYSPATGQASMVTSALLVENTNIAGYCDFGFHLVGVVYETDTGYLSAPGPEFFGGNTYVDITKSIRVSNIPVSPNAFVKKRHLVSTKWIPEYNGDQKGYQFFFIPEGNIDDNTTTTKVVKYYDADLLDDASHLIDNFSEIPAGVNLNTYHSRLVVVGEYGTTESLQGIQAPQTDNRSIARLSAPGEPEAINKVDGIIIAPLDGNALTNVQEFRDVLYLFKRTRTIAYVDNGEEPVEWKEEIVDQGVGAPVHGIAAVLDSGGVNVDYLIIADWSGLMLFNGTYARPEMSFKIEDYWQSIDKNNYKYVQLVNDSISKKIWMTLPPPFQHHMLHADYGNGLDAKNIRWARWIFDAKISSICLLETNKLMIGIRANVD